MAEVDRLLTLAREALASGTGTARASAREALEHATFRQRFRGYARADVDPVVAELLGRLGP